MSEPCPRRPLLPTFTYVVPMGPDRVQLMAAGRRMRLSASGIADMAVAILAGCDGSSTVPELAERLGIEAARVDAFLADCYHHRMVLDAADDDDWPVLAHNRALVEALALTHNNAGRVQRRLGEAFVAIVGLGPIGRLTAAHLASAGVGRLALVDDRAVSGRDDDVVGPRVPSASEGGRRTDVVAEECRTAASASGDHVQPDVSTFQHAGGLFPILHALDLVVVDAHRNATRQAEYPGFGDVAQLPYAVGTAETVIGPLVLAGRSPCPACVSARRLSHSRAYDEELAFARVVSQGAIDLTDPPMLGGYAAIVAGTVSVEALRAIGNFGVPQTLGGVLVADVNDLSLRREAVLAVPGCLCDSAVELSRR